MNVYKVEDGATIWVAATDIQSALRAMDICYRDSGAGWPDEHISVNLVTEAMARKVRVNLEEEGQTRSAWELAQECTGSSVIGGSDWP
jgi:hypothetical protein